MGVQPEQRDLELDPPVNLGMDLGPDAPRRGAEDRGLTGWATRRRRRPPGRAEAGGGLRFAFYGRVSTVEYQDAGSSLGWQRDSAAEVIAGRGQIVQEFFDAGCSRRVPWPRRRQGARLLQAVSSPDRGFDAIIVGESERAFTGTQLLRLAPVFLAHGVQMWLPEVDGPVDLTDPAHRALIMRLGERSRREVGRAKYRTTAAMRVQARDQGRYLGGRPPYGYRLVDAGPHPNTAHAAWGRRLHRLDPDPATADTVRWIFTERLAGRSLGGIARHLNDHAVPSPSAADPGRNPHRRRGAWTVQTIASILGNPRYTGRQVWNRQPHHPHRQPDGDLISVQHWAHASDWVISPGPAHPALVSEADFVAAQAVRAARATADHSHRTYRLTGLLRCGVCGRRLDAHWVNNRPGYRCRHGTTTASASGGRPDHEPYLYVREDELLHDLADMLTTEGRPSPTTDDVPGLLTRNEIIIICDRSHRRLTHT
ncbi:MAG TPA: recombinase family protein [Kineosporiaceae bacterium]